MATKNSIVRDLETLTRHSEWPVRHAGFQGLKYVLAAQQNDPLGFLATSYRMAMAGLQVLSLLFFRTHSTNRRKFGGHRVFGFLSSFEL